MLLGDRREEAQHRSEGDQDIDRRRSRVGGVGVEGAVANVDRSSKALLDPLLKTLTAVVSPHLAGLTGEMLECCLVKIAEKGRRLRAGEAMVHRVV